MSNIEILTQKGYNFLWIDDGLVMWDLPIEKRLQESISKKAYGVVLIAGYGLGLVQEYLIRNPLVKSVLTIEKFPEVIEECKKIYGKIYGEVLIEDFFDLKTDKKFDCVIGDVWEDIVPDALKNYKEFKSKANGLLKQNGKILAWGKEFFEYSLKNE